MNVGVVGYGYWGPNVVRNFNAIKGTNVIKICDTREIINKTTCAGCQETVYTKDFNDVVTASDIDIVAIVTPVSTHYELAKKALEHGKHVFVEKPFTYTHDQAEELINLAEQKNLKIAVDHTFLFTGAVSKMKQLIDSNELGKIYYYDSTRINLGLIQRDVNVIWDLAPHDFAILRYLIKDKPEAIRAFGKSHINQHEDVAYILVYFSNDLVAHFNVNWLSPMKVRTTMIGGEKKMLMWNDVTPDEKIKIYDKGVDVTSKDGYYDMMVSYRSGDVYAPKLDQKEALFVECSQFIDCILNDKKPLSDGHMGLEVVRLLEASERSIKNNGGLVLL